MGMNLNTLLKMVKEGNIRAVYFVGLHYITIWKYTPTIALDGNRLADLGATISFANG